MNVFSVRMRNEKLKRATNEISDLEKTKERKKMGVRSEKANGRVYKQSIQTIEVVQQKNPRSGFGNWLLGCSFSPPYNVTVGPCPVLKWALEKRKREKRNMLPEQNRRVDD